MNLWIWRHIRLELPQAWELLQFSKRPDQGLCLFADRHAFRLEFSWREVPGPPDFERMIHDYEERLAGDYQMTELARLKVGDWHGLRGRIGNRVVSRYGGYLAAENCLVELVLPWEERAERVLEERLLDTVRVEPPRDSMRRWRACGLDCQVAEDLDFTTCEIRPGQAQWSFTQQKQNNLRLENFSRVGMLKHWLKESVATWLRGKLPKEALHVMDTKRTINGHEVQMVKAQVKPRFPKITAKPWHLHGAAWICPTDHRLYSATIVRQQATDELPARRIACCPTFASAMGAAT